MPTCLLIHLGNVEMNTKDPPMRSVLMQKTRGCQANFCSREVFVPRTFTHLFLEVRLFFVTLGKQKEVANGKLNKTDFCNNSSRESPLQYGHWIATVTATMPRNQPRSLGYFIRGLGALKWILLKEEEKETEKLLLRSPVENFFMLGISKEK